MSYSVAAMQAKGKSAEDNIFAANNRATALADQIGKENVINGTVGSILDENGDLVMLEVIQRAYKRLTPREIAAYPPIQGYPDYLEACLSQCFGDSRPAGCIRAVSTPGGTGGLHHAVHNYSSPGDEVLMTDWHWGAYDSVMIDAGRKPRTFSFLTEDGHFNLESFKENVSELVAKQYNTVIILNGIANNPTGYCMTDDEWGTVADFCAKVVEGKDKNVILVADIAYLDYSGEKQACRRFFKKFENLPKNVLVLIPYTLSKGFTLYGQRMGALICVTQDESVAQEFVDINQYSSRACWSNCNGAAMKAMASICKNPDELKELDAERAKYYKLIQERAAIFMKEADAAGLKYVPYISGFFITIPMEGAKQVCGLLEKRDRIFLVPLKKGIRLAVCSVSKPKITGLAAKIAEAVKETGAKQ